MSKQALPHPENAIAALFDDLPMLVFACGHATGTRVSGFSERKGSVCAECTVTSSGGAAVFLTRSAGTTRGKIDIYNCAGRHIITLHVSVCSEKMIRTQWDGKDSRGVTTAPGVYTGVFATAAGSVTVSFNKAR